MNDSLWGSAETQYFYELTPERILAAVEAAGFAVTGRILQLSSLENRVWEVEIDVPDPRALRTPSERFRIVKFYRPGRWSAAQIREEHAFLYALAHVEIPAIAPLKLPSGDSLGRDEVTGLYFAVFPKRGGRVPEEPDTELLERMGALMARVHNVGATLEVQHRTVLDPSHYGYDNLDYLLEHNCIPAGLAKRYADTVEAICSIIDPWWDQTPLQPIHGDAHLGNVLEGPEGLFLLDFDDMVIGPPVQDLWLLVPERGEAAAAKWQALLGGYERWREFDRGSLRMVEGLRALRFVHFSAWIARRWGDPAFPAVFPHFGEERYWAEQVADLDEQLRLLR